VKEVAGVTSFEGETQVSSGPTFQIRIAQLPELQVLEAQWRSLEERSDCSFFLSWSWIGSWLMTLPSHVRPRLVEVTGSSGVVAMAVLVERAYRRHRLFPVAGAYLNTTGDPWLDAITIEYNDLLVDRSCSHDLRPQVINWLLAPERGIDELVANGVLASGGWDRFAPTGYSVLQREDFCRSVDLQRVRDQGDFLALLSANTRSNVRRSRREFEKMGVISTTLAADLQSALEMFSELRRLHGEVWLARGEQGAFANDYLSRFHQQLIEDRFASGEIQLISIAVASHVVGILYNFVFRGRVYSYQSGFDYHFGSKQNRPGLLAHSLAIELNARSGYDVYDFMAGDSQYKRSLATSEASMRWLVFQRDCFKFQIENGLRRIRRALLRRFVDPS
jgi:CelD/BcsL family acetyltransferase involved in cellulose biosynthesis